MGVPRQIVGFGCRLLLIYGALVALLPVLSPVYAVFYSAGGNLIFQSSVPGGYVHIHPLLEPTALQDTHIHAINRRTGGITRVTTDSRKPGYLPTAFLVSLVLATPLPWRRRLWALASGLILVNVFIAWELLVMVLDAFSIPGSSLWGPAPPWDTALAVALLIASRDVVTWFMVPALIWILVSFRQTDWETWVQVDARQAAGQPQGANRRCRGRRASGSLQSR